MRVGSIMLLCVIYKPDPILVAVAWASDEGGGGDEGSVVPSSITGSW